MQVHKEIRPNCTASVFASLSGRDHTKCGTSIPQNMVVKQSLTTKFLLSIFNYNAL